MIEVFRDNQLVHVVNIAPLKGNTIAPPLRMNQEVRIKTAYTCRCGNIHYDVGLVSKVNSVTCVDCREDLPNSDSIHWVHPSRLEKNL